MNVVDEWRVRFSRLEDPNYISNCTTSSVVEIHDSLAPGSFFVSHGHGSTQPNLEDSEYTPYFLSVPVR